MGSLRTTAQVRLMTPQGFEVVVVGNVGIDTNVYVPGSDIDFAVESNFTENLDYVGQAGGYSSRGYAQLGRRTAFIGYVGDDYQGRFIRREFARDGIDTNGAGDGLAVGFLTSYVLEGYSLHDSIRRGQIAARHTCTQRASSSSLITAGQLEHYSRIL